MNRNDIHSDCIYFQGHIPCAPHKRLGVHCVDCQEYQAQDKHILIIKLGAIGDVIRTTPLLTALKKAYPSGRIYWLTHYPEVLPMMVDVPLKYSVEDITYLQAVQFDVLINLDKDREACALTSLVRAKHKWGFTMSAGKPAPITKEASHKFLTGLFDDVSKANPKNYLEEIFSMCGLSFQKEEYILELPEMPKPKEWKLNHKKNIVALNTGCGDRWVSRLWATENWIALASLLQKKGKEVVLLGGEDEDKKNRHIAKKSGAKYFGYYPLKTFFLLVNECDILVTTVTMGLHVGIGLKKKIVLLNNIFNPHEFELYGRGVIVEPAKECKCFFLPRCTNAEYFCMEHIEAAQVAQRVLSL